MSSHYDSLAEALSESKIGQMPLYGISGFDAPEPQQLSATSFGQTSTFPGEKSEEFKSRRRHQNRAAFVTRTLYGNASAANIEHSQRAFRARQKNRMDDMQRTINTLLGDRKALLKQVDKLKSDLIFHCIRSNALKEVAFRKSSRAMPRCNSEASVSQSREDSQSQAVDWMLKHVYGLKGRDDGRFEVVESRSPTH